MSMIEKVSDILRLVNGEESASNGSASLPEDWEAQLASKQDVLTAGDGIFINNNVISLEDGEFVNLGPPEFSNNAQQYGWYGTLAMLGAEAPKMMLKTVSIYRRQGGTINGGTPLYLRVLRKNEGDAWHVAYQSTHPLTMNSFLLESEEMMWTVENVDGSPNIPTDEPILICFVSDTSVAADTGILVGFKPTSVYTGVYNMEPPFPLTPSDPYIFGMALHITGMVKNEQVLWENVLGRPETFPPETHTHDVRYPVLGDLGTNVLETPQKFLHKDATDGTQLPILKLGSQFVGGGNVGTTMDETKWRSDIYFDKIKFLGEPNSTERTLDFRAGRETSLVTQGELDSAIEDLNLGGDVVVPSGNAVRFRGPAESTGVRLEHTPNNEGGWTPVALDVVDDDGALMARFTYEADEPKRVITKEVLDTVLENLPQNDVSADTFKSWVKAQGAEDNGNIDHSNLNNPAQTVSDITYIHEGGTAARSLSALSEDAYTKAAVQETLESTGSVHVSANTMTVGAMATVKARHIDNASGNIVQAMLSATGETAKLTLSDGTHTLELTPTTVLGGSSGGTEEHERDRLVASLGENSTRNLVFTEETYNGQIYPALRFEVPTTNGIGVTAETAVLYVEEYASGIIATREWVTELMNAQLGNINTLLESI